jgi:osmotically-inducible protein OsmY
MNDVSDGRISEIITNKLAARGLSSCRLTVQTSNGQVTLSGTVERAEHASAAAAAARGMSGVQRVVNQIMVKPPLIRSVTYDQR